jgi:Na+/melibiose symporter-like transporter
MSESRVSTSQIVSYSLPAFGTAMVLLSVAILPNYYTDELGPRSVC